MPDRPRVLITGSQGFLGKALSRSLQAAGYDVWGVDRVPSPDGRVVTADLLDYQATCQATEAASPFDILIHGAALTHSKFAPPGESCLSFNTKVTENVLRAIGKLAPRMVFLSSVSVYGEDGRHRPVTVADELRPATEYARSKVLCEQQIIASDVSHCDILRLAPIYDETHLNNVRKRAFLPGFSRMKILLRPSPKYSLCHVSTLVKTILDLLDHPPAGRRVFHVTDSKVYDQNELASRFNGVSLRLPANLLRPVCWLTPLLPRRYGYPLRCLYWKLFRSNVYAADSSGEIQIPQG